VIVDGRLKKGLATDPRCIDNRRSEIGIFKGNLSSGEK